MNILITSAGRRVSLVKFFMKELKRVNPEYKVFTVDMNPEESAACNISDGYNKIPRISSKNYIDSLLDFCKNNEIGLIIPTIDTELLILSQNISLFKNNNVDILISDQEFINKCRDKRLIHKFFTEYNIKVAKDIARDNITFPFFAKPFDGSCSQDTYFVQNEKDLTSSVLNNNKLMFLEYIDSNVYDEYTVDMYYDKNSRLKSAIPRKRIEVRSGEVSKSKTIKNEIYKMVFDKLSYVKGLRGCITLQVFFSEFYKDIIGIEINPRFGGGYPLSYLAGANFPEYIVKEYLLNEEIDKFEDWEENLLMLRYDSEVLIHNID